MFGPNDEDNDDINPHEDAGDDPADAGDEEVGDLEEDADEDQ